MRPAGLDSWIDVLKGGGVMHLPTRAYPRAFQGFWRNEGCGRFW